jgi:hypothetical protein
MAKNRSIPLGCVGNKTTELKLLLPIIEPHITNKSIFVEPFCGSCVVSHAIYKNHENINFHVNDIDENRIQFYINMKDEEERTKLYKLEESIVNLGSEEYNKIIKKNEPKAMMTEYIPYIISRRINAFRYGLYPTTKKIILKEISESWINFFKKSKITNNDFKEVMNEYKDNKDAFLYLDPPYMDSYNGGYSSFYSKNYNDDLSIKDNTEMYIYLLEFLKDCKCKVLFSINNCALTKYIYKDFIKDTYNKIYQSTQLNTTNTTNKKKNTDVLIISNF